MSEFYLNRRRNLALHIRRLTNERRNVVPVSQTAEVSQHSNNLLVPKYSFSAKLCTLSNNFESCTKKYVCENL